MAWDSLRHAEGEKMMGDGRKVRGNGPFFITVANDRKSLMTHYFTRKEVSLTEVQNVISFFYSCSLRLLVYSTKSNENGNIGDNLTKLTISMGMGPHIHDPQTKKKEGTRISLGRRVQKVKFKPNTVGKCSNSAAPLSSPQDGGGIFKCPNPARTKNPSPS